MRVLALALLLSLPLAAAQAAAPANEDTGRGFLTVEASLRPAISTYRVTLVPGTNDKFVSAEGSFTDKSAFACDGWRSEQRLFVQFTPPTRPGVNTPPVFLRTGANIFEARNGLVYRFEDKSSMGGQILSSHKGEAILTTVGGRGTATFTDPPGKSIDLPAGTVFPINYASELVKRAGTGQTRYEATMFDGTMSAEAGVLRVITNIAKPRAAAFRSQQTSTYPDESNFNTQLAWPARTAIYKADEAQGTRPLFEQHASLLANGRAETLIMDFTQFKLRMELVKYEELPVPTCP